MQIRDALNLVQVFTALPGLMQRLITDPSAQNRTSGYSALTRTSVSRTHTYMHTQREGWGGDILEHPRRRDRKKNEPEEKKEYCEMLSSGQDMAIAFMNSLQLWFPEQETGNTNWTPVPKTRRQMKR